MFIEKLANVFKDSNSSTSVFVNINGHNKIFFGSRFTAAAKDTEGSMF